MPITTIIARGYVTRESKRLFPTELGRMVNSVMTQYFAPIVDLEFTAQMEEKLDSIEAGKLEWKQMLGPKWEDVHTRLLHTIGNLTLTAYNSEMSDRPFSEKMEMEGGFKQSALKLNSFVVQCSQWTEKEINARSHKAYNG